MYDVAVIGAGVTGAMIARTLCRFGLDVCILEKENDAACGATKANSAIVHAGFDAAEGSLKAKLNVQGSKMMKKVTDGFSKKVWTIPKTRAICSTHLHKVSWKKSPFHLAI